MSLPIEISVVLSVHNVDKWVFQGSERYSYQLGSRGTASVILKDTDGSLVDLVGTIQPGLDFALFDHYERVWGGSVEQVTTKYPGGGLVIYEIQGAANERKFDKRLVTTRTYTNMSAGAIARDLVLNGNSILGAGYPGIGFNESIGEGLIEPGDPVVSSITFDYCTLSNALDQLAEGVGFTWYLDPTSVFYFCSPVSAAAPFTLTGADVMRQSFVITDSRTDFRDRQFIRVPDGTVLSVSDEAVRLERTVLENNSGWYDSIVSMWTGVPGRGAWRGQGSRAGADDTHSFALYEAQSELDNYKIMPRTIECETKRTGLRAGQTLSVNIADPEIMGDFMIDSVEGYHVAGNNNFRTKIRLTNQKRTWHPMRVWEKMATIGDGGGAGIDRRVIVLEDTSTGATAIPLEQDVTVALQYADIVCNPGPTGDLTVDVTVNGASIFGGTKLVVPAGTAANTVVRQDVFANTTQTVNAGDIWSAEVVSGDGTAKASIVIPWA